MLLWINSLLLVIITVYISLKIVLSIEKGKYIDSEIMKSLVAFKAKKDRKTGDRRLTFIEKLSLKYIERSNIKEFIPFFKLEYLIVVSVIIFGISFSFIYRVLYFVPSAILIASLFSFSPFLILDILGRYNSARIRRELASFISILNRWCAVKEDLFYAFEKSVDSGIDEPLKMFITDMVVQVKRGIPREEALEMLRLKVNNSQFSNFIINVKMSMKNRGDIRKLLTVMEEQFYRIEEEFNRRNISTFRDRIFTYAIMVSFTFIGYGFIKINPDVESFYLGTVSGKILLTAFCFIYAVGFFTTISINSYKH